MEILRLAGIIEESIVDGPGLRLTVFTQGCPHHCPGCHNPETHSFDGGYLETITVILDKYRANPLLSGITFSGGEPFMQPEPLAHLAEGVHASGGDVITYTGYVFEALFAKIRENPAIQELLEQTDILVDGPFIESLRSLELPFRGSSNQRMLSRQARADILAALKNLCRSL